MKLLSRLIFAIPFFVISCNGSVNDVLSTGRFNAAIRGDIKRDFKGLAGFTHRITTNAVSGIDASSLVIVLTNETDQREIITLSLTQVDNSTGIPTGTYDFNSTSGPVFLPGYVAEGDTWLADESLTNSVIISKVSDTQVKGEYTLNLMDSKQLQSITITGAFDALGVTTIE